MLSKTSRQRVRAADAGQQKRFVTQEGFQAANDFERAFYARALCDFLGRAQIVREFAFLASMRHRRWCEFDSCRPRCCNVAPSASSSR